MSGTQPATLSRLIAETEIPAEDTRLIASLFRDMKLDPYCEGGFRYRALNRYWCEDGRLVPRPQEVFYQSPDVNRLWGGMRRDFPELPIGEESMPVLTRVVLKFLSLCGTAQGGIEVQVHPIRTVCAPGAEAEPAPEGFHTDGYMFSSIYVVRRDSGLSGGSTFLRTARTGGDLLFERTLPVGALLAFDDSRMFHYTSPIQATGDDTGVRDVMVFTVSPREGERNGRQYTR